MAGGFVFVVGPTGSGKDSLIAYARTALAGEADVLFPRRIVTRPGSAHEDHDSLDEAAFARGEDAGAFALSWRAHGLGYAIPGSALEAVGHGRIAVCNVSRRVVPWSRTHLPNVAVVEVTAPAGILAARLAGRGRPEDGDLAARLARSLAVSTPVDARIVNDRTIAEAGDALVAFIAGHVALVAPAAPATVVAVSRSPVHGFSKPVVPRIVLVAGHGVEGDAHAGVTVRHRSRVARDPSQPNLRQVHLVHAELLQELAEAGFAVKPGDIGENVLTRGLDLLALPQGARLSIGASAVVEVTGLRNPCSQLDDFQPGLMRAVLGRAEDGSLIRKAGVMATVLAGGAVAPGDAIRVALPAGAHRKLERV